MTRYKDLIISLAKGIISRAGAEVLDTAFWEKLDKSFCLQEQKIIYSILKIADNNMEYLQMYLNWGIHRRLLSQYIVIVDEYDYHAGHFESLTKKLAK